MKTKNELTKEMACGEPEECLAALLPVRDALEVLSGRWKLPILIALSNRPKRFKEISKDVNGITDKMLSKELKDLEITNSLPERFMIRFRQLLNTQEQNTATLCIV